MVVVNLKEQYSRYLESKKGIWSTTTLRSEAGRLNSLWASLTALPLEAKIVWGQLVAQGLAPYTRNTMWTRLSDFCDWLVEEGLIGVNGLREFRRKNPQLFRNSYERKIPEIGYDEAIERINCIPERSREKALQLLRNGLRYTESGTLQHGRVKGKGGKVRRVFNDKTAVEYRRSYSTFVRDLATQGLTPHMLRKICACEFLRKGGTVIQLMQFLGHTSLNTTQKYADALALEVESVAKSLLK